MAKRRPLTFDSTELAENLQKSAAKGIDAFFSSEVTTPPPGIAEAKREPKAKRDIRRSSSREMHSIKPKEEAKRDEIASNHDTMTPRHHDTTVSWYHDKLTEIIRKAVREFGKEAATHRFTMTEKQAVANLIFTYKSQGIRTSENEIARIAINYIVEDFNENGENSILDKVMKALNE